ncbi:MAG TPA: DUF6484 domain-containing protein [Candidatus Methylomirabilis sp.]|nr:DUF6484 domain-containing protein [Candidatus Methylomirabilis sp.]
MKVTDFPEDENTDVPGMTEGAVLLLQPLEGEQAAAALPLLQTGIVGELIALTDNERTPLVLYRGQPGSSAIRARTVVDVHRAHIGAPVLLIFEDGDPAKPIIAGVIRGDGTPTLDTQPGSVDIDADGKRLVVSARQQLVLSCGRATITLTSAGHVIIRGTYVSSNATGVNRITGGSVEIN